MNKRNSQDIILAKGDRGQILIRGLGLNKRLAKIYAEEYLGNVNSTTEVSGPQALGLAIFSNTNIVDIDADCVI